MGSQVSVTAGSIVSTGNGMDQHRSMGNGVRTPPCGTNVKRAKDRCINSIKEVEGGGITAASYECEICC